jgi:hypothetical protein
MAMGIDEARHHGHAAGIDGRAADGSRTAADGRDAAAFDQDVTCLDVRARSVEDPGVRDEQILRRCRERKGQRHAHRRHLGCNSQ